MSLVELFELFPDDTTAEAWFELQRWGKQICCPRLWIGALQQGEEP